MRRERLYFRNLSFLGFFENFQWFFTKDRDEVVNIWSVDYLRADLYHTNQGENSLQDGRMIKFSLCYNRHECLISISVLNCNRKGMNMEVGNVRHKESLFLHQTHHIVVIFWIKETHLSRKLFDYKLINHATFLSW